MRNEMQRARHQQETAQVAAQRKKLAEETARKNRAAALETRHIFFVGDDVLLNAPEVTSRLKLRWSDLKRFLDVRTHLDSGGLTHEVATVESVIQLADSGKLGTGKMGQLEAYVFATAADLEWFALVRRGLGFLRTSPRAPAPNSNPILERLFDQARARVEGGANLCVGDDPAGWPMIFQHAAWAAVDGVPGHGAVRRLEDAAPFELCVCNEGGSSVAVYIRSLKGPWAGRHSAIWYDVPDEWRAIEERGSSGGEANQGGVAGAGQGAAAGN